MDQQDFDCRLSFILPFTLHETFANAGNWRKEVNEDCSARFLLLLRSFLHMFRQNDLCEFIIVCPANQCTEVRNLVSSVTCDPRYFVVSENEISPGLDAVLKADVEGRGGWYAQQIVKLAAHRIVASRHYMVLDSDLVCIQPCSHASFVKNGRPLLNIETVDDYTRLYSAAFVIRETQIKTERRVQSLRLLGRDAVSVSRSEFYGETPVILSAAHVAATLRELESVHGQDWISVLAGRSNWTEFGLYFGYLDALDLTDAVYLRAGCNAVLSLDKSAWLETSIYRTAREYDCKHFFHDNCGFFVAIQSWLPKDQWLPQRYACKRDFYRDMERWLAKECSASFADASITQLRPTAQIC